ncbi:hypothetical protein D3C86_1690180 [compost metagenome]
MGTRFAVHYFTDCFIRVNAIFEIIQNNNRAVGSGAVMHQCNVSVPAPGMAVRNVGVIFTHIETKTVGNIFIRGRFTDCHDFFKLLPGQQLIRFKRIHPFVQIFHGRLYFCCAVNSVHVISYRVADALIVFRCFFK